MFGWTFCRRFEQTNQWPEVQTGEGRAGDHCAGTERTLRRAELIKSPQKDDFVSTWKSHILCLFVCRWRDLKVMCCATSRQQRTRRRWRTSWRRRNANYSERWSFPQDAKHHFQIIFPSRSNKITVKNQTGNINTAVAVSLDFRSETSHFHLEKALKTFFIGSFPDVKWIHQIWETFYLLCQVTLKSLSGSGGLIYPTDHHQGAV